MGRPQAWPSEDEKWVVVDAELPVLLFDLKVPANEREQMPNICKRRFHELCWHFNVAIEVAVKKSPKPKPVHRCLTVKVMSALKQYAFRENPPCNFSPGTALSEHVIREIIILYRNQDTFERQVNS